MCDPGLILIKVCVLSGSCSSDSSSDASLHSSDGEDEHLRNNQRQEEKDSTTQQGETLGHLRPPAVQGLKGVPNKNSIHTPYSIQMGDPGAKSYQMEVYGLIDVSLGVMTCHVTVGSASTGQTDSMM